MTLFCARGFFNRKPQTILRKKRTPVPQRQKFRNMLCSGFVRLIQGKILSAAAIVKMKPDRTFFGRFLFQFSRLRQREYHLFLISFRFLHKTAFTTGEPAGTLNAELWLYLYILPPNAEVKKAAVKFRPGYRYFRSSLSSIKCGSAFIGTEPYGSDGRFAFSWSSHIFPLVK